MSKIIPQCCLYNNKVHSRTSLARKFDLLNLRARTFFTVDIKAQLPSRIQVDL